MSDIWVKISREDAEVYTSENQSDEPLGNLRRVFEASARVGSAIRAALDAKVEPIKVQRYDFLDHPREIVPHPQGAWLRNQDIAHLLAELAARRAGDINSAVIRQAIRALNETRVWIEGSDEYGLSRTSALQTVDYAIAALENAEQQ